MATETRTEYRIDLRENLGGGPDTGLLCGTLNEAKARADACRPAYGHVRIQARSITIGPWVDLPDPTEEGGANV